MTRTRKQTHKRRRLAHTRRRRDGGGGETGMLSAAASASINPLYTAIRNADRAQTQTSHTIKNPLAFRAQVPPASAAPTNPLYTLIRNADRAQAQAAQTIENPLHKRSKHIVMSSMPPTQYKIDKYNHNTLQQPSNLPVGRTHNNRNSGTLKSALKRRNQNVRVNISKEYNEIVSKYNKGNITADQASEMMLTAMFGKVEGRARANIYDLAEQYAREKIGRREMRKRLKKLLPPTKRFLNEARGYTEDEMMGVLEALGQRLSKEGENE